MAWFQKEEEEGRKRDRGKEQGGKTSFTNNSQLWPSSSHFSCQELQPTGSAGTSAPSLPDSLQSKRNPSQGEGLSSIHPQPLHRDFNNSIYILSLSARAAIMSFITMAAASARGQLIGDEIFAVMAEHKVPPSVLRIIIVILSSLSVKL